MRQLVCIAALLALAACATPSPFSAITLGGEPTVTSTKRAAFSLLSGSVTSEIRVLALSERDQSEFVELLAKELLRLKVFQAVSTGHTKELPDFKITVTFAHTRYSRMFVLVGMGATCTHSTLQ